MEAIGEQPTRVRLRHLEDVELRVDLLPDRRKRRDRLVEDDETAGQLEVHRVDQLEALPDDLQRVDVREPAAVVAVEEDLQLAAELLLAGRVVADAEVAEPARDRIDVLRRGVDEEHRELRHVVVRELPGLTEVDEPERARLEDVDVRRVRVGVEEAMPEHHRHPGVGELVRDLAPLLRPQRRKVEVRDLRAAEELEREDARGRVLLDDTRDDDPLVPHEVPVEHLGVSRFVPVVELEPDRARELVDEVLRIHELEGLDALLEESRGLVEESEVRLDLLGGRRALHLDRHFLPVREHRPMHLADRGRGERREVELEEGAVHAQVELGLDDLLHLLERDRRRVVLEISKLRDDVRGDHVRTRREQLPELHERRAELVQHGAETPAAIGRGRDLPVLTWREVTEAVSAQDVAEAVACRHLRDLGETPEVPRRAVVRRRHAADCRAGACGPYELVLSRSSSFRRCSIWAARRPSSLTASREAGPGSEAARAAMVPPLSPRRVASRRQLSRTSAMTARTSSRSTPTRLAISAASSSACCATRATAPIPARLSVSSVLRSLAGTAVRSRGTALAPSLALGGHGA